MVRSWANLATLVILTAGCIGGGGGTAHPARSSRSPIPADTGPISSVRICGDAAFDASEKQCRRDERDHPITDGKVHCTSIVKAGGPGQIRVRWLYEGSLAYSVETESTGTREPLDANLTFGPHPLPGGTWRCEISGIGNASVDFRGAGPTGPLMYTSACDSAHVAALNAIHPCNADEGDQPFHNLASVTCSALFTGVAGRKLGLEIVFDGKFQAAASQSTGFTTRQSAEATGSVLSATLPLSGRDMTLRDEPLPPGPYACRWLVDGVEVGRRPFTVAGD